MNTIPFEYQDLFFVVCFFPFLREGRSKGSGHIPGNPKKVPRESYGTRTIGNNKEDWVIPPRLDNPRP